MKKSVFLILFSCALILTLFFLFSLISQSQMVDTFPLDFNNDYSSHIAKTFFLSEFSYSEIIPYWFGGFRLFDAYPPAYYYLSLFFSPSSDYQLGVYLSLIFLLGSAFLLFYFLLPFPSKLSRSFFFLLIFANPVSVGNFIRIGRLPELFSFILEIFLLLLCFFYFRKSLDIWFYSLFTFFYFLLILTHPAAALFFSLFLLFFWFKRSSLEKFYLLLTSFLSTFLSSFWWVTFIRNSSTVIRDSNILKIFSFNYQTFPDLLSLLLSVFFLVLVFVWVRYFVSSDSSREYSFFLLPLVSLCCLILSSLILYIPVLRTIHPDSYFFHFLFWSFFVSFLFFKTLSDRLQVLFSSLLLVFVILSLIFFFIKVPLFANHNIYDRDSLELLSSLDQGSFLVFDHPISYSKAYYSYAPIYFNLSSPSGWVNQALTPQRDQELRMFESTIFSSDCVALQDSLIALDLDYLLSSRSFCENFSCNYSFRYEGEMCLIIF